MKDTLAFELSEDEGKNRISEFIRIGIPLPVGEFFEPGEIGINSGDKQPLFIEVNATAFWPDNSIKWCIICFFASMAVREQKKIYITKINEPAKVEDHTKLVTETDGYINVKTKNLGYQLSKKEFNFIDRIVVNDKAATKNGYCRLSRNDGESLSASIDSFRYREAHSSTNPLYTEITLSGHFEDSTGSHELNFESNLWFMFESDRITGSIMLHNPNRVMHSSGLWDLGDRNSIFIDEFSLGLEIPKASEIQWKSYPAQACINSTASKLQIYQESSGGINWNSPNHRNKDNHVAFTLKGYTCDADEETTSGDRASPSISILDNNNRVNLSIDKFWQNFPKAVSVDQGVLNIGLFPKQFPDDVELQGGEKKTHKFSISFIDHFDSFVELSSPISIKINPDWLKTCNIFPHEFMDESIDPLRRIINEGLSGENSFFSKRERIDEYGWRNFGDLYADHEADLQTDNEIFVSHYNNQYDPLFGFLFQYLISGNRRWLELANDLAQHVTDIDIYHTVLDKDEYNGGAFWHTDHYLDAATSSHRSHSRDHDYQHEGHAGGGGPGGQHCYTSGLLLHYLITGSESSKKAVFQLSEWITNFYESSGTFFDFLIALKNSSDIGTKNILTGQYPLDRGTAYYINTLLDKYYLTGDSSDLNSVEHIIRNTISPYDNLLERELTDVESRWHYTVFLQSLIRYLKIKEECSKIDVDFKYARDALLKYSDWMLQNEYPYLEKPEILQFPNHTWTAQDIRKVHILYNAALFSGEKSEEYRKKSLEFYLFISNKLESEPTKTYTRILSILMQTPISLSRLSEVIVSDFTSDNKTYYEIKKQFSLPQKMMNVLVAFIQVLKNFSIKKEIQWLDKRTHFISKLKGSSR